MANRRNKKLKVSRKTENQLKAFLENRESDIAHGIEDFKMLLPVFIELMLRKPRKDFR